MKGRQHIPPKCRYSIIKLHGVTFPIVVVPIDQTIRHVSEDPMLTLEFKLFSLFTRVETLIVATIYLQLIQNRYMFRSFTVLQCSHQHCVQPVASDGEVVGYL